MDKNREEIKKICKLCTRRIWSEFGQSSSDYINGFREKAMDNFLSWVFPTRKNEAYKYTNLEPWFRSNYKSFFIPEKDDFDVAKNFQV